MNNEHDFKYYVKNELLKNSVIKMELNGTYTFDDVLDYYIIPDNYYAIDIKDPHTFIRKYILTLNIEKIISDKILDIEQLELIINYISVEIVAVYEN